jgi:hypothetical protein
VNIDSITPRQVSAAFAQTAAIAEAIRELGEVPSGHLYAQVCGRMELAAYERIIGTLKNAGLVAESGHLLKWIGPTFHTGGATTVQERKGAGGEAK